MKVVKNRDKLVRLKCKLNELEYLSLKFLVMNSKLDYHVRRKAQYLLNHLVSLYKSKVFINNICVVTTRSRSVFKDFKVSRMVLRKFVSNGYLTGLKKYNF